MQPGNRNSCVYHQDEKLSGRKCSGTACKLLNLEDEGSLL